MCVCVLMLLYHLLSSNRFSRALSTLPRLMLDNDQPRFGWCALFSLQKVAKATCIIENPIDLESVLFLNNNKKGLNLKQGIKVRQTTPGKTRRTIDGGAFPQRSVGKR